MSLKRTIDVVISLLLLVIAVPVLIIAAVAIKATSPGPVVHWSRRVGRHNTIFKMAKLRTMRIDTPDVATHKLDDPGQWITPVGGLLRRTSIDELPQIWHVLIGEMSLVGPRPALHNQDDLIELRTERGVSELRPGVTGLAQIRGRDELAIPDKGDLDVEYLQTRSVGLDLKILVETVIPVVTQRSVVDG